MLELIVLGEVPGTQIVISYQWALILAIAFTGAAFIRSVSKKQRSDQSQESVDEITL